MSNHYRDLVSLGYQSNLTFYFGSIKEKQIGTYGKLHMNIYYLYVHLLLEIKTLFYL